jgi:ribosomal subunit interface protein
MGLRTLDVDTLMQTPLQIRFHNVDHSPAVEAKVREQAARLERYHGQIMGCQVTIEAPHRHHHQGNVFHVRIRITVPSGELAATRDPGLDHGHEDVYVAIRDAFQAARRQLEDHARRQRGEVKHHEAPPRDTSPQEPD